MVGWVDEWWKTAVSVARCWSWQPYGTPGFDAGQCQYKAHVDCPNKGISPRTYASRRGNGMIIYVEIDITQPSLCGFWMDYPYDKYVNEGYWGIMRPSRSSDGSPDVLVPRAVYTSLQALWVDPYNTTCKCPHHEQSQPPIRLVSFIGLVVVSARDYCYYRGYYCRSVDRCRVMCMRTSVSITTALYR